MCGQDKSVDRRTARTAGVVVARQLVCVCVCVWNADRESEGVGVINEMM